MSWVDITIIALVVLLGLFGVLKGFKKSLLSMGAFLVAFLLAFFLANVIAEALLGIDGVKSFVLGNGFGEKADFSLANWLYSAMGEGGAKVSPDSFIGKNFYMPILEIIAKAKVDVAPDQGLALYLAFIMFSAMCGVGIFIISRFLLVIVTVIVKSYIGKKKSPLSRLAGFCIGAVRGAMWAFAITLVFSCMGGLTFLSPIRYVENEYEHKNAVFCQYFNEGAYYIRNKLFLPDSDAYGRIVNLVFKKGYTPDPDEEKLTGARLELFINLSNLNYEDAAWTIDPNTKKRKFDEDATARQASDFAVVGFDAALQAIMDYNSAAAAIVDDIEQLKDFTAAQFEAYNGLVQTGSTSVYNITNDLINKLRAYKNDYEYGNSLTEPSLIDSWNSTTLSHDYKAVCDLIDDLAEQYGHMPEFGAFPDMTELIPDKVVVGANKPEQGGGEQAQTSSAPYAVKRELATAIPVKYSLVG